MPGRYAELLGERIGVEWPRETWLADVDPGFYVACYLRAWALEVDWRSELRGRFGADWLADQRAGDWLRGLWARGQRLDADRLVTEVAGRGIEFGPLAAELS
jgi:hypothetical protein